MMHTDTKPAADESRDQVDIPGVVGMFIAILGAANLLAGMAIPLIPWILSGLLVIPLLVLGFMARPPLRRWVITMGFLCAVPPVILACVELFTNL